MRAFSIIWTSIKSVYDELYSFIGMNLIWFGASLVALLILGFFMTVFNVPEQVILVIVLVFIIGPNPAAAGLHYYARHIFKEEIVGFHLFWEGLRAYARWAAVLFLVSLAVAAVLLVNLSFYAGRESESGLMQTVFIAISVLVFWVLVLWLMMQPYMLPLLIEQQDKRIIIVIRNSALLAVDNMFMSFLILVVFIILSVIALILPLIIATVGAALMAMISERMTLEVLPKYRRPAESDKAG